MSSNPSWEFPPYTKTTHRSSYAAIDPKNPANSASGKVVLVTGGGSGVGKGVAKAFVEAGAKAVAILGRRKEILTKAKTELESAGSSKILAFEADVVDQTALNAAFESVEKAFGGIDVVVANAGYFSSQAPAATADVADWWKAFEINIKGTLLTFQAFMAHKGHHSLTFIALNTGAAHVGVMPNFSGYAVSKAGEAQLIPYLQAENPDVKIVSFHPGVIETEMMTKSGVPFTPDDMSLPSSFAVWLATSPAAGWVGGRFLWAHWDVDELAKMKEEIVEKDELKLALNGWPREVGEPEVVW